MDQRVESRENLRDVGSKTGEPDPSAHARLARPTPPGRKFGALAHHDQIGVPFRAAAKLAPRAEDGVESLSAIAERADEANQWPAGRLRQGGPGPLAFLAVRL